MLRKLICMLLALATLPAAMAEGFAFDGAITWASAQEDAMAYLGEGAESDTTDMGDYGAVDMAWREGGSCLGMDCGRRMLMFYDGDLCDIYACFTPENLSGDFDALVDRLTRDYGAPTHPDPKTDVLTLEDLAGLASSGERAQRPDCVWTPDDDTRIELWNTGGWTNDDGTPYPYLACLEIWRQETRSRFEQAMSEYLDDGD